MIYPRFSTFLFLFFAKSLLSFMPPQFSDRISLGPKANIESRYSINKTLSTKKSLRTVRQTSLTAVGRSSSSMAMEATGKAIAQLTATLSLGISAAHLSVLPKSSLSVISKLIYGIFQPSLLFTNVAKILSKTNYDDIGKLLLLPLFASIQVFCGLCIGKVLLRYFFSDLSEDSSDAKEITIGSAFGNSAPLPLLFVDAMALESKAVGYISFYLLAWSPLFWSLGRKILLPSNKSLEGDAQCAERVELIFTPPNIGCVAGACVGSFALLRHLFMDENAILSSVTNSVRVLSNGYLPSVGLTLAGSLYYNLWKENTSTDDTSLMDNGLSTWSKILVLSIARFVFMPLIGMSLINIATKAAIISKDDKILRYVLMLESCMPSAQNSVVILQLTKSTRSDAGKLAKTLSLLYLFSVLPLTFWLQFTYRFAGL